MTSSSPQHTHRLPALSRRAVFAKVTSSGEFTSTEKCEDPAIHVFSVPCKSWLRRDEDCTRDNSWAHLRSGQRDLYWSYKVCQSTTELRWQTHKMSKDAMPSSMMDTGPWCGLNGLGSNAHSVLKSESHVTTRLPRDFSLLNVIRRLFGTLVLSISRNPTHWSGRCLSTKKPLCFAILSLFAQGLNDRIAAVSRLRTISSRSILNHKSQRPRNFIVCPSASGACLLRFFLGKPFSAPAQNPPAISDQFVPTTDARVSTSTQTHCSGRVDPPTNTRKLTPLFLPLSAPEKHGFAREPKPTRHWIVPDHVSRYKYLQLPVTAAMILSLMPVHIVCSSRATGSSNNSGTCTRWRPPQDSPRRAAVCC